MERQRVLYTGGRQFRVVVEEQVLRTRVGHADVMAGQLDRLLAVMSLPRVQIGKQDPVPPVRGDLQAALAERDSRAGRPPEDGWCLTPAARLMSAR